jgi:hypothetical protein
LMLTKILDIDLFFAYAQSKIFVVSRDGISFAQVTC